MMRTFLRPRMAVPLENLSSTTVTSDSKVEIVKILKADSAPSPHSIIERPIFTGYVSNLDDETESEEDEPANTLDNDGLHMKGLTIHVSEAPPLKRHQHEIPVRLSKKQVREKKGKEQREALDVIRKLITSKKEVFDAS